MVIGLLHHFHFDEIGCAGDADGDTGDDDDPVPMGSQAYLLRYPLCPIQHIIRVSPVRDEKRCDSPAEVETSDS